MQNKITPNEWKHYVVQQMYGKGFSQNERDFITAVFSSDLNDSEYGESASLFGSVMPGISDAEFETIMGELRDPYSIINKTAKVKLSKDRLDKLEVILHEALIGDKEGFF